MDDVLDIVVFRELIRPGRRGLALPRPSSEVFVAGLTTDSAAKIKILEKDLTDPGRHCSIKEFVTTVSVIGAVKSSKHIPGPRPTPLLAPGEGWPRF